MVLTRSRQAKLDVDSVYGLLGILAMLMEKEPRELLVQPDLNKPSLEEVMENTTLMLIRHSEDLTVLHQVQERSIRSISGCSSWTVNWRQRMAPEPLIMSSPFGVPWKPAGTSPTQCPDTSIPRRLRFQAARIASIVELSLDSDSLEDPGAWLTFVRSLCQEPYGAIVHHGLTEILWRTAIADMAMDQCPAASHLGDAFVLNCLEMHCQRTADFSAIRHGTEDALFCDEIKLLKEVDTESCFPNAEDIPSFLSALRGHAAGVSKSPVVATFEQRNPGLESLRPRIDSIMLYRRFARTQNNLLAAVPVSSEPRDEIWVIPGLATPFVFRGTSSGEFEFVGESYVHGIMNGEILGSLNFQTITLK